MILNEEIISDRVREIENKTKKAVSHGFIDKSSMQSIFYRVHGFLPTEMFILLIGTLTLYPIPDCKLQGSEGTLILFTANDD